MHTAGKAYVWLARGAARPLIYSSRVDTTAVHAICGHRFQSSSPLEELLLCQQCPMTLLLLLLVVLLLLLLLLLVLLLLELE